MSGQFRILLARTVHVECKLYIVLINKVSTHNSQFLIERPPPCQKCVVLTLDRLASDTHDVHYIGHFKYRTYPLKPMMSIIMDITVKLV